MNSNELPGSVRLAGAGGKAQRNLPYTSKDFQLEVLGQLAEMRELAEGLRESIENELGRTREPSKRLPLDGRTIVAIGALALSITGYVLQDARNTSKRDSEIEMTRARVTRMEEIAVTSAEGRIRTEVELGELRDSQAEIKRLMAQHDNSHKPPAKRE
jgi:hypothetical protein